MPPTLARAACDDLDVFNRVEARRSQIIHFTKGYPA